MKKRLLPILLAGVLTLSGIFVGCSSKQATSDEAKPDGGSGKESEVKVPEKGKNPEIITVLLHSSWRTDASDAAFEAVGKKLNVKFEFEEVAEGDAGEQLICAKMATDDVPDILWWQAASAAELKIGSDKFTDLSGEWEKDYDQSALKTTSYTINNRLIRAPFGDAVVYGICYNKEVFSKYNLQIPDTWDELIEILDVLKNTEVIPMFYSGSDSWTLQIQTLDAFAKEANKRDGVADLIDGLNTNKLHWAELSEVRDGLEKTKSLISNGYVQDTYLSDTYQDAQQALLDGTCAMYIHATWIENELEKITDNKDELDKIGFFAIPGNDDEKTSAFITPNGFYVPEKAKNKELAIEIVKELVSPETAKVFFSVKPGIPFVKGVTIDSLFGIQKDAAAIIDAGKTLPPAIDYIKFSAGPFDTYIADVCVDNWTVDDMLKEIDSGFAKQAKDQGDENWK